MLNYFGKLRFLKTKQNQNLDASRLAKTVPADIANLTHDNLINNSQASVDFSKIAATKNSIDTTSPLFFNPVTDKCDNGMSGHTVDRGHYPDQTQSCACQCTTSNQSRTANDICDHDHLYSTDSVGGIAPYHERLGSENQSCSEAKSIQKDRDSQATSKISANIKEEDNQTSKSNGVDSNELNNICVNELKNVADDCLTWSIIGIDCASCATTIRKALERLPDIKDIDISVPYGRLRLRVTGKATQPNDIEKLIRELGYQIQRNGDFSLNSHVNWWQSKKFYSALTITCLLVFCYASTAVLTITGFRSANVSWIFTIGALMAIAPIAKKTINSFKNGNFFSIEMLMLIATLGAIAINASEEALVVVFLYSIGEVLEQIAANHARNGIKHLETLLPKTVLIDDSGIIAEKPISNLEIGQILVARPGERLGADGTIISGKTSVDEAAITGESKAIVKKLGSKVFAGSINLDATIRVRVEAITSDNTIARIMKLIENAEENKAITVRLIDKFSKIYTPIIVIIAVLIAVIPAFIDGLFGQWIYRASAILLIGCPCALVISVPTAIAAGIAKLSRKGILIKGGNILETLAKIDLVAFDKTGTLTMGVPVVTETFFQNLSDKEALSIIYGVERESNHPLANAITRYCKSKHAIPAQLSQIHHHIGQGMTAEKDHKPIFIGAPRHASQFAAISQVILTKIADLEAQGNTVIIAVFNCQFIGLIALRDVPRPDAKTSISALKKLGIGAIMLTGDNKKTAAIIGNELGVTAHSELAPEAKVEVLKKLNQKHCTLMIGDGVNDAPALAQADVGIAMGSGTALALETANGAFLRNNIADLPKLLIHAKNIKHVITQNIMIALGLKLLFLITTLTGLSGLWMAILADTGATLLVTLNAMRLLKAKL